MTYRVTNSMMQQLLLNDMHTNLSKLIDVQQQLSTQRKYQYASENPNAVTKGMNIETMMVETEQYKDNLLDAVSWLKFTDSALGQMTDVFQRIRELAIYGGDGVLEGVDLQAIGLELGELKKQMVSLANSTIAGEYLFAGLLTEHTPFTVGENGDVVYNGNDYSVKWEFSRKEVGKVSITGSELFPKSETTHSLKSFEVPLDFAWTGRNEKLEFKVGWQTVSVRIPERWQDEKVNGLDDYGDYNRYRDIDELEGWSLQEIADLINNSTEMGDVSKLLKASVVTDTDRNVQRLVIKSLTGEPVRITGWPDPDPIKVPSGIKGAAYGPSGRTASADGKITIKFSDEITYEIEVKRGDKLADIAGKFNALPDGKVWAAYKTDAKDLGGGHNACDWLDIVCRDESLYFNIETSGGAAALFTPQIVQATSHKADDLQILTSTASFPDGFHAYTDGGITIDVDGKIFRLTTGDPPDNTLGTGIGIDRIVDAINDMKYIDPDPNVDPAKKELKLTDVGITAKRDGDKLVIERENAPNSSFTVTVTGGLTPLFSDGAYALSSVVPNSEGKYTAETALIKDPPPELTGNGGLIVRWDDGTTSDLRDPSHKRLGAIATDLEDLYPEDDPRHLKVEVKTKVDADGDEASYLEIKADRKFTLSGYGSGAIVVGSYNAGSQAIETNTDHTHIGFAEYMGLETTIKSTELQGEGRLGDTKQAPLHIKFVGEHNRGEVYIADDAELTIDELANRINGVCGSWLTAVVEVDEPDGTRPLADKLDNSENNAELATKRLVLRTKDGESVAIYDGAGVSVGANAVGSYAAQLGIATALAGKSQYGNAQNANVFYPEQSGNGDSFFDENIPAIVQVTVGTKVFECKVCKNNCYTAELVASAIARQVNEQYGGTLLAWDANDIPNDTNTTTFSLFAVTGEPLRVVDKGYGDPRYTEFSGGVAMQLGVAAGVTTKIDAQIDNAPITDRTTFDKDGVIRISAAGHSVDVPVLAEDTLQTLAARIRDYAGDWADVSFYDSTVGPTADGGKVRMSIAAKDGSPLSIVDINWDGSPENNTDGVAHMLGINTGLVSTVDLGAGNFPTFEEGDTLTIKVNGAEHTIDLWDHEIANDDGGRPVAESVEDLAAEINARFQGKDIVADVYKNGDEKYLILTSPWGYDFELSCTNADDANDILTRLGFEDVANSESGDGSVTQTGANYNQIVTRRTGNNVKNTDFFGVMDNLIDCVEGGNVDGISDVMIGQLDNWMNTLLKCRAQVGALQQRYQSASYRMTSNNTNYTELWTNSVGVDLAEVITNYQMASNVYEASLAALARIIQPTLLNFLS